MELKDKNLSTETYSFLTKSKATASRKEKPDEDKLYAW